MGLASQIVIGIIVAVIVESMMKKQAGNPYGVASTPETQLTGSDPSLVYLINYDPQSAAELAAAGGIDFNAPPVPGQPTVREDPAGVPYVIPPDVVPII